MSLSCHGEFARFLRIYMGSLITLAFPVKLYAEVQIEVVKVVEACVD